jgi:hypothetical protein
MRPPIGIGVSLLALSLLGGGLRAEAKDRQASKTPAVSVAWVAVVSGSSSTPDVAEQMALEKARLQVSRYLRLREPALRWTPDIKELREWKMLREVSRRSNPLEHEVEMRVEVTDENFQQVLSRDRQERVAEVQAARHLLAAKLLAALVALLAVAAGYFRLEELTRGYYTGSLRVLALVCIAGVAAGLWLLA